MIARSNILAFLRRRRRGLGTAVVLLFTAGNVAASAAPCLAMASHAAHTSGAHESLPAHASAAHAESHVSIAADERPSAVHESHHHELAASGSTDPRDSAAGGHHSHAVAQTDAAADVDRGSPAPGAPEHPSSRHCPHCPVSAPLAHSLDGAHAFCTALDDGSADGQSGAKLPAVQKHLVWLAHYEIALPPSLRPSERRFVRADKPPVPSPVALNLRHCVFLI
jgi:hypothetical protein